MIYDLDQGEAPPEPSGYDLCVAGAGVAGTIIAKMLADRGQRVLLLEAGGKDFSERSQNVYRGDVVGREYFDLDAARLRYLGGSSNHWGGMCRPLDAHDFERREHIDGSGWPISRADLEPYRTAATEILEIENTFSDIPLAGTDGLHEVVFQFSRIWFKDKYQEFLGASDRVDLLLNANLLDITLDSGSGRVAAFAYRGYNAGAPVVEGKATLFVLALGGIENARMLLSANRQRPEGIGNEHGLVGRYFLEHPHFDLGYYVVNSARTALGDRRRFVSPTGKLSRRQRIGNCGLRLLPVAGPASAELLNKRKRELVNLVCASDTVTRLVKRAVSPEFRCRVQNHRSRRRSKALPFDGAGLLRAAWEQVPHINSRVMLGDTSDDFGRRRAVLDWRLSPQDKRTVRESALAIGRYFAERDIGRVKLFDWVLTKDTDDFPGLDDGEELAGNHHMGTTRMGTTARDGVVDRDCTVFGVDNLFTAGSSVFRTGGHVNPTFTIVQLALRLSDHLAARLV